MLNVILAEDHTIVRYGIQVMLEMDQSIKIVGEASHGYEVLDLIAQGIEVDVVLSDINMPKMDGITLIKEIKAINPRIKVVLLSMFEQDEYIIQAFQAGTDGYLIKSLGYEELIFALKHVHSGEHYVSSALALSLVNGLINQEKSALDIAENRIDLSERELEVLNLMAEGLTNVEMAEKLFVSKRTIEGYRQSLMDKTGSRNTVSLIRFALKYALIL